MHAIVTGGAGFIGRWLVPLLLQRGHDVTVIDSLTTSVHGHSPALPDAISHHSRLAISDIRNPSTWAELDAAEPEVIIHLAAETGVGQSMYEVSRYLDVNLRGMGAMLEGVRERWGVAPHFVLASSRAVYGEGTYACEGCGLVAPSPRSQQRLRAGSWEPQCPTCSRDVTSVPTDEGAARRPGSVYALTKASQEDLAQIVAPALGATVATLRLSNVYGEGQPLSNPYTGVLSAFALRLVNGLSPRLYEDGNVTRDFVHVSDVARAIANAVETPQTQIVNVGSGERWTLLDIARRLTDLAGIEEDSIEITGQYRVGDIRHFVADVSRLRDALLTEPGIGLDDGLSRFLTWAFEEAVLPDTDVAKRAEEELSQLGILGQADG